MKMLPFFDSKSMPDSEVIAMSGVCEETPIRDLCAQLNWKALRECYMFFVECGVKM
jgi:hypothetical protein